MNRQAQQARIVTETLLDEFGTYSGVARFLEINPAHVWKAVNKEYVSPKLIYALARKDLIKRPSPKDRRNRVWMRTDNINKAIATMQKHYPHVEVVIP